MFGISSNSDAQAASATATSAVPPVPATQNDALASGTVPAAPTTATTTVPTLPVTPVGILPQDPSALAAPEPPKPEVPTAANGEELMGVPGLQDLNTPMPVGGLDTNPLSGPGGTMNARSFAALGSNPVQASPATAASEVETKAEAPATTGPVPSPANRDMLIALKQEALLELTPLVGHLNQTAEEKFRTTMMMIQATDDDKLIKQAYELAKQIEDEKVRAQALLDVVNEINYFTNKQA